MHLEEFLINNDSNEAHVNIDSVRSCWKRPPVPFIDQNTKDLIFQTIDIDSYNGNVPENIITKYNNYGSILRLYGVCSNGNTVLVHCYGFRMYFYVEAPPSFDEYFIKDLKDSLNKAIQDELKNDRNKNYILLIEIEMKSTIYGFNNNKLNPFLKITVSTSSLISTCRRLFEKGISSCNEDKTYQWTQTYESNIDFDIRFMVDLNMSGCSWMSLKAGLYKIRSNKFDSNCQIEADVGWEGITALPSEGIWDSVAPYRILSYDIECSGRKGTFPEAQIDPIIQIGNTIAIYGLQDKFLKVIFTLKSCAPIVGSTVFSFENEKDLLKEWVKFVQEVDPDIIIGYNIFNFDTPYFIDRANHFKIDEALHLGRIRGEISRVRTTMFQNKAFGKRENKAVNISGREHKLRSYTLNNVSFHFLGEQKEDVHHSIISDLQNGDEHSRRRLAVYCLKDSYLPLRLLDKLMVLTNHIEMSRVTGVPINCLLTRGQQVKVISQLLRQSKLEDLLIPCINNVGSDEFEGATVIQPAKGFYNEPIATLDFMSLYPSIMIAHNLCYSTLISASRAKTMNPDDFTLTPSGHYFVKSHIRRGVLPFILQRLLDARKHVKQLLKTETDPLKRKVFDGRQLAIKLSANSVYGFTGAQVGKLPCLEISGSVTAFGREMIEKTKSLVESHYAPYKARVIYGDTDSVMINFGIKVLSETMKLAKEAAEYVSDKFPPAIRLEFEKVYFPYLLINKKRYAGLIYTRPEAYDRIDCKGIETVRRDNCLLVANLISECLSKILIERDPKSAVKAACSAISDLLTGRIDLSLLIISKELRKTGEDYTAKQPHSELAERMKKRDPGSAPKLGDRVPFVYIMGSKNERAYERAEDPIYVLENNIPIDTRYYLENQLAKPLTRLFEPILGEKTQEILLKGEHTLIRSTSCSNVGLLRRYTKKVLSCVGCKATISCNNHGFTNALCSFCDLNLKEFYIRELNQLRGYQKSCSTLWTECQRCQGSFVEEVICTNRDCPIFYMRTKVLKDIEKQEELIKRFNFISQ